MSLIAVRDTTIRKDRDAAPGQRADDNPKTGAKQNVHYIVIVRLPFPRGDFVDPGPVNWDTAKDRKLWKLISRNGAKLNAAGGGSSASASEGGAGSAEVNWDAKAAEFGVDTRFLLQQAAWLYERHLEHVKKQVGRLRTGSAAGTPQPGQTSMLGKKPVPASRAPSALSMRSRDSPLPRVDVNIANASQPRPSGLSRTPSATTVTQSRQYGIPPSPKSRNLRPPSIRKQPSSNLPSPVVDEESPGPASSSSEDSSNDEDVKASRRVTAFRRAPRFGARQSVIRKLADDDDEDGDGASDDSDDDEPTFYSTAQLDGMPAVSKRISNRALDDTLKEAQTIKGKQPVRDHNVATDKPRAAPTTADTQTTTQINQRATSGPAQQHARATSAGQLLATESSASSLSSANAPAPQTITRAQRTTNTSSSPSSAATTTTTSTTAAPPPPNRRRPTHPLSPRHRADHLARLSSPRRSGTGGETSDGTPSMGSSFSDLDVDASVTQSALEEALASNLRNGGSRLSNISNAFRSRYMQ